MSFGSNMIQSPGDIKLGFQWWIKKIHLAGFQYYMAEGHQRPLNRTLRECLYIYMLNIHVYAKFKGGWGLMNIDCI